MPRSRTLAASVEDRDADGACTTTPTPPVLGRDVRTSGCTRSTFAATARHLVGRHHPRAQPEQQRQPDAERRHAQPPARDRAHAPWRAEHQLDRVRILLVSARAAVQGDGIDRGEASLHVLAQLVGVVRQQQQIERRHRAGVDARMPDGQSVGDDRRAGRLGLQARDAPGRVHEHVGGRQQVGHPVGEPVDAHAWLLGEALAQLLLQLLVAAGQADDAADLRDLDELGDGSGDVANAPAAAGDDDHPAVLGQARARGAPRWGSAVRGTPPRSAAGPAARCRGPQSARPTEATRRTSRGACRSPAVPRRTVRSGR